MKIIRISLAIVLMVYSIPALLSGLDIYYGIEPELSSEWIIVWVFFVFSFILCLINLFELKKRT